MPPSAEEILGSFDTYISWIKTLYPDHEIEMDLAVQAHALLNDSGGDAEFIHLPPACDVARWRGGRMVEKSADVRRIGECLQRNGLQWADGIGMRFAP